MTKVRALRQARGLNIVEFSREARVNPSAVSCVERRKAAASRRMQEVMSAFFGIPQAEAFDGEGMAL